MRATRYQVSALLLVVALPWSAGCDPMPGAPDAGATDAGGGGPADDGGGPPPVDADGDGVPEDQDCDDADDSLGAIDADRDCDGILTDDDCGDTDATLGDRAQDQDCDRVLTTDDCDDTDDDLGAVAEDADCDGTLTAVDCDDDEPSLGSQTLDADCDGTPGVFDCDDDDPAVPTAEDADCDGVLVDQDCDDEDDRVGSIDADADCDGFITGLEARCGADGLDPMVVPSDLDNDGLCDALDADADGDGAEAPEDCDDQNAAVRPGAPEVDWNGRDDNCDGVVANDLVEQLPASVLGDVWVSVSDGARAFVGRGTRLLVFDLVDAMGAHIDPVLVHNVSLTARPRDLVVQGGKLYVGLGHSIDIWDVTDPAVPPELLLKLPMPDRVDELGAGPASSSLFAALRYGDAYRLVLDPEGFPITRIALHEGSTDYETPVEVSADRVAFIVDEDLRVVQVEDGAVALTFSPGVGDLEDLTFMGESLIAVGNGGLARVHLGAEPPAVNAVITEINNDAVQANAVAPLGTDRFIVSARTDGARVFTFSDTAPLTQQGYDNGVRMRGLAPLDDGHVLGLTYSQWSGVRLDVAAGGAVTEVFVAEGEPARHAVALGDSVAVASGGDATALHTFVVAELEGGASPASRVGTGVLWSGQVVEADGRAFYRAGADQVGSYALDPVGDIQLHDDGMAAGYVDDVTAVGSTLYALRNGGGPGPSTIDLYSTTPQGATKVGELPIDINIGHVTANAQVLFAAGSSEVRAFDLSNPLAPVEVGSVMIPDPFVNDVVVKDDVVFVSDRQTLYAIDMTDPASPGPLASLDLTLAGNILGSLTPVGDVLFATSVGNGAKIWVVDISSPTSPSLLYDVSWAEVDGFGHPAVGDGWLVFPLSDHGFRRFLF